MSLNIAPSSIAGVCNSKCDYSFNYPTMNITVTNGGTNLLSSLAVTSSPPVTFNSAKYMTTSILITCPSIHTFNNSPASGEIIIVHTPVAGGLDLIVCIPLSISGTTTSGSSIINQIVAAVSTGAPTVGENTSHGIDEFTLNDIVPMSPFYTYTGSNYEFIVYGIQYAIGISQTTLSSMQSLLKAFPNPQLLTVTTLFSNPDGPSSTTSNGDGQIYIDCQPTGHSEEEVDVTKEKTGPEIPPVNLAGLWDLFIFFIYTIICVALIVLINKGLKYMTGTTTPTRKMA